MIVFSKTRLVTYNFFGIILCSYSSSLCCKTFKRNLRQKKKVTGKNVFVAITRGHKIVSSGSRTRGIFIISAFSCRVPVS